MEFKKFDKYTLLKPTRESVDELFKKLELGYDNFKGEHLIIDISEKINIKIKEIMLFLNLSKI